MATSLTLLSNHSALPDDGNKEFVTMRVGGQLFGIDVMHVHDVLRGLTLTPVPLAPAAIAGSLNLRGRIVTALDMRLYLGLPPRETPLSDKTKIISVVVEQKDEYFTLIVDSVGEVIALDCTQMEKTPATLVDRWRDITAGIYPMQGELLVILDVAKLLSF
jgi:purine-binding chemotaxis protein CheW